MLWGWSNDISLDEAAAAVARAVGVSFRLHDSSFYGGDYMRAEIPGGEYRVVRNYEEVDGEMFEAKHPEVPVLLYIEGEQPFATALDAIPGLERLDG